MELLKSILGGASGAAIFTGLFAIIQGRLNRKDRKEDTAAEKGIIVCNARGEELKTLGADVGNLTIAMRAILYDRIKHLAKTYIARGYITVEEYEDLKRMHGVYHNEMHGNGFLDGIMEEIEHLEKRVS